MREMTSPRRPRLNCFSPLPPSRTEIAANVARSLPALAEYFEVALWAERPYWSPALEAHAHVRAWEGEPWAELNAADATLYHIGNNARYHGWIWDIAQRHSGIVVLHDTGLHEFLLAHLEEHPHAGLSAAGATAVTLERARGAVVHSGAAFQHVAALRLCPVVQLDLPYPAGRPVVPRSWDGILRVVLFGYLGANRRLASLLEAMASFADRQRLRLVILGELEEPREIAERIQAAGVGDLVDIRGFVPEAELEEQLDRAHLAVNLRYPSLGEASASQLRIWDRGLGSLVTRTGWYAELPSDTVWFVDPGNEVEDLQRHFRAALDAPAALQAMGTAGRHHLESRHDPRRYASELADSIARMTARPTSIVGEAIGTVSRILADGGITGTAKAAVARRAGEALSRWVS
jgi:glycosyltransferase involved in cell wall biosynthesis